MNTYPQTDESFKKSQKSGQFLLLEDAQTEGPLQKCLAVSLLWTCMQNCMTRNSTHLHYTSEGCSKTGKLLRGHVNRYNSVSDILLATPTTLTCFVTEATRSLLSGSCNFWII